MRKRIVFFSIWGIALTITICFLMPVFELNWVLLIHIPLLTAIIVTSSRVLTHDTKKNRIMFLVLELSSVLIALGLTFFIDVIFDYDDGNGFSYFMERIYSLFAAILYGLNLFGMSFVFAYRKKSLLLALILSVLLISIVGTIAILTI